MRFFSGWLVLVAVLLLPRAAWTSEPSSERVTDVAAIEHTVGRVKLKASGNLSGSVQGIRGGGRITHMFGSPFFASANARFDQERRLPYDLRHWGGDIGVGWAFTEQTGLTTKYRLDSYKVFNTGDSVDPAFRTVTGRSEVTALGLGLQHDSRDDRFYPTSGDRWRLESELAMEALGGDYNFGRVEAEWATYLTPFRQRVASGFLQEVTVVEHASVGWVAPFGETDAVPFFERYFVGGTTTVRGHRSRWLTPRGLEDQFVGGELKLVNNIELRVPIFPTQFNRQLSAAVFFDAGRAFHRFSEIGDFGYGVGGGLRYLVHFWKIQGVVRADYAFSLDHEGDDSTSRFHLTFGLPF